MVLRPFEYNPVAQIYVEGRQQEVFDDLAKVVDDRAMQKQLKARDMDYVLTEFADARAVKDTLDQLEERFRPEISDSEAAWPSFEGETFESRQRRSFENAFVISQAGRGAVGLVLRQEPDNDPRRGKFVPTFLDKEKLGLHLSAWFSPQALTVPSVGDTLSGVYSALTSQKDANGRWKNLPLWHIAPEAVANDRTAQELNWSNAMIKAGFYRYQQSGKEGVPKPSSYNYDINGFQFNTKGVLYTNPRHDPGSLDKRVKS